MFNNVLYVFNDVYVFNKLSLVWSVVSQSHRFQMIAPQQGPQSMSDKYFF